MNLNDKLYKVYASKIESLKEMYTLMRKNKLDDFAGPLLLYAWEEKYYQSNYRILFLGQETNGWYYKPINSSNEINEAILEYKKFDLGSSYNTLFWQKINYLNYKLNGKMENNYLWRLFQKSLS